MAFDGVTVAAVVHELNRELSGGRISKIAQPEKDELILTVKANAENKKLLISADASLPLIYLTDSTKESPMQAPSFCMLLRKHLQGGKILGITQPGLERIVRIDVEHSDEMGDLRTVTLITEIMGKHSNIILADDKGVIIDSIKRISGMVSSVREVLPGREYFIPETTEKADLLSVCGCELCKLNASGDNELCKPGAIAADSASGGAEQFASIMRKTGAIPLYKSLYTAFTGISPVLANEILHRAGIDADITADSPNDNSYVNLYNACKSLAEDIAAGRFIPCIVRISSKSDSTVGNKRTGMEFAAIRLSMYEKESVTETADITEYSSISELLEVFYREKNEVTNIRQRSADLRKIVTTLIERDSHKLDQQLKQLKDTKNRDKYRLYGELLNAYVYMVPAGADKVTLQDYNTGKDVSINLDPAKSATENAQKFFDKYNKQKRTYEALVTLTEDVRAEIDHLKSILTALDIARRESDLSQIRDELVMSGYMRDHSKGAGKKGGNGAKRAPGKNGQKKSQGAASKPMHYISSDGYDIYVGKNNIQNDELTFKFANSGDWWFHAKKMPGSHVILRTRNGEEVPDRAFEEAASLAAYYSAGREAGKVEIDYVLRKEVKKPAGAKPGFVVYYTNYSMTAPADISALNEA
ncbi:MAG: NFACT family protein [Lachnospiraceae bacterium]|nr:NFACT family protein [Lachnospiraceae bacterium]